MAKDSKGMQREAITECLRMLSDDKECYRGSKTMIKDGTRCYGDAIIKDAQKVQNSSKGMML